MNELISSLKDSSLSETIKEKATSILEVAFLEDVLIDEERKIGEIYFRLDGFPSLESLSALERFLNYELGDDFLLMLFPMGNFKLDEIALDYYFKSYVTLPKLSDLWLSKCSIALGDNGEVVFKASSSFLKEKIEERHSLEVFKRFLENLGFKDVFLKIILEEDETLLEKAKESLTHINQSVSVYEKPVLKTECGQVEVKAFKNPLLYGKRIAGQPRQIHDIIEEENHVILQGSIFGFEVRSLKSGRNLVQFAITDLTDSITCKLFCKEDETERIKQGIKENEIFLVKGNIIYDERFSKEHCLELESINVMESICRVDMAKEKRIELHLHTKMSDMDGISNLKDLVALASEMGHKAIALTDHGVVQAFPEAYFLGQKYNIKILYGVEAYIFDDSISENLKPRNYHCIILAKDMLGLENLYKLVTESHLRYFKRRPRIPKRLLNYVREHLIIGSACEAGELFQYMLANPEDDEGLKTLAEFYDYIEIQPRANNRFMLEKGLAKSEEDLINFNKRLYNLGVLLNKRVVATCDVHFAYKEEAIYRSILMSNRGFKTSEQPSPLYYRSTDEMLEEFSYLGDEVAYEVVVKNPNEIAEQIEVLKPVPDDLYAPFIEGAEDEIERLTYQKAHRLYGEDLPTKIKERIERELKAIIGNGFAVLYLIAHKLVKKSNDDGYVVGSRGSVGSSVVAYFTDITDVNALPPHYRCSVCQYTKFGDSGKYGTGIDMPDMLCPKCGTKLEKDGFDIPFEIFMGFKGDKVPDIDLNFSGDYQPEAHKYTEALFGIDNVFRAGTIATVAEKTAISYVLKYAEMQGDIYRQAEVKRLSQGCTGVKRTTGQHPGGLMVIPKGIDVHKFTPLQRPANDVKTEIVTTHFDYHSISERLVKLDILGHDNPTVIKMLEDLTGVDVSTIPLDDVETLSLFSSIEVLNLSKEVLNTQVGTYGIPEFNTKFTRDMLVDANPKSFSDLLRISGFSHGTDVWLNNAKDLINAGIASVSETISTRDDIMNYLIYKGLDSGLAFKIMEKVRKGRGVSDEDILAMREVSTPEWFIESCQKIKYLFPKAHAVAYVVMAFQIAWFKINYPLAFYASFFTVRGADEFDALTIAKGYEAIYKKIKTTYAKGVEQKQKDKAELPILEVALECVARGYQILPVSISKSLATTFVIEGDAIRPPLTGVSGLGANMAESIVCARDEMMFTSIEDLEKRSRVGRSMTDFMKELGVLENLPDKDQLALF